MKYVNLGIKILFGAGLVFFGLNKFGGWFVPPLNGEAGEFMGSLATAGGGYIMLIVAVVEIIAGLLFVIGKFVPLAAILLFPIMLNAFLFHLFLDPAGIGGSILFLLFNIYVMITEREKLMPLLKA